MNGMNDKLGLPFGKMVNNTIAVDVDGTLRCNCTPTCEDPNMLVVRWFNLSARIFKNVEMFVWSGGGADYARRFATKFDLIVADKNCLSKIEAHARGFIPDIAVDDIQDTAIGEKNLIVRMK